MSGKIFSLILLLFLVCASSVAWAQTSDAVKPSVVPGEVSSVSESKIVLQTKDGTIEVALSDKTEYKRVSAVKPSLQTAVVSSFSDIGVGDKVIVTGFMAGDKKSIPARAVYLMTKSDIAGKQTKDQEQWKTRGISGQVAAINPQTKEITVSLRGFAGAENKTIITPKDNAVFRRYAADSNNYSAAKISSSNEIKIGDSIRALGEKSEDGATFKAEEIISGSFQTIGGTITAIDAAKNEITISNIQTKKSVTVVVGENSVLKQFPPEMAQKLAAVQSGGGGIQPPSGVRPPNQQQGNQTDNQTAPGGMRQGDGMRGAGMRGGGGIDEMLERFPTIKLIDLKVGDMIAFSSTRGTNQDRVTAIKLLSGVEPFLKTAQTADSSGGRRGSGGGQNSGFSIPGLDGGF